MRKILQIPAVTGVLKKIPQARNSYIVFDSIREFADDMAKHGDFDGYHSYHDRNWCGDFDGTQSIEACRNGDMTGVPIADKMLSDLESKMLSDLESVANFRTQAFRIVHDIAGGVPNVPAFLAGHPNHMRRRERVVCEQAPLTIVADLCSSGGIDARDVQKRGAAILALVRIISDSRPVELWATCELDAQGDGANCAAAVCIRIDTAPLDLARAAHVLTSPSVPRALCYGYVQKFHGSQLRWAYGSTEYMQLQRDTGAESFKRIFAPNADCLYVPPVYLKDPCVSNPVQWIKTMVAKHGGLEQDAA